MEQDLESQIKESKYPICTQCQNVLPHCHCKCPYCGNSDCVCEFSEIEPK